MAEAATAVQEARPLTDAERDTLTKLLARDEMAPRRPGRRALRGPALPVRPPPG